MKKEDMKRVVELANSRFESNEVIQVIYVSGFNKKSLKRVK